MATRKSTGTRTSAKSPKQFTSKTPTKRRRSHGKSLDIIEQTHVDLVRRLFGCSSDDIEPHSNLPYVAEMVGERYQGIGDRRMGLQLAELDLIADYNMPAANNGPWPHLPHGMDPQDYGIGTPKSRTLASLEWWITLAAWIPGTRTQEMLPGIFTAYTAAIEDPDGCEGFKALRAYRLYTRHLCKCAEEAWPQANLRMLLMLV